MSDTLPNVTLPANVWVDLYAATGITVGDQILTQNLGSVGIRLHSSAAIPTVDGFRRAASGQEAINDAMDAGAWAYSPVVDGLVNVKAVI